MAVIGDYKIHGKLNVREPADSLTQCCDWPGLVRDPACLDVFCHPSMARAPRLIGTGVSTYGLY